MGAHDEDGDAAQFEALRDAHARMGAALAKPTVDLIELAKSFAALANAMAAMARQSGRPSLRFEVVARALDLRTTKSALTAFLEG